MSSDLTTPEAKSSDVETSRTLLGFGKPKKGDGDTAAPKPATSVEGVLMAPFLVPPIFDGSRFTQFCMFPKSLLKNSQSIEGMEKLLGPVSVTAKAPDGPLEVTIDVDPKDVLTGETIHRFVIV